LWVYPQESAAEFKPPPPSLTAVSHKQTLLFHMTKNTIWELTWEPQTAGPNLALLLWKCSQTTRRHSFDWQLSSLVFLGCWACQLCTRSSHHNKSHSSSQSQVTVCQDEMEIWSREQRWDLLGRMQMHSFDKPRGVRMEGCFPGSRDGNFCNLHLICC